MSYKMAGPAAPSPEALTRLRPLDHDQVVLDRTGWLGEWQTRNVQATIPHVLRRVRQGKAEANLRRLVDGSEQPLFGLPFTDTDVFKTLEAIAWASPELVPDDPLLVDAEALVELLERVQEPDGYLNSTVQGTPGLQRWSDPHWGHEMYTAGHLFQAAVAASRTGSLPGLTQVAARFADLLVARFGVGADTYVEGHPEVETALVELYRETGERSYLELARRLLEQRGHGWLGEQQFGSAYFQDHAPVRSGAPATGHAVRQIFLLTGAVDIAVETGDDVLLRAAIATWDDLYATKTYITGAHGSRHRDEAIGDAYELPADRAYAETCAAVASFQLAWRLLLATGEARFAEEMERVLYNAVAVSTGQDGVSFFYSNPLHLRTGHAPTEDAPSERQPWYHCPCCPPNIARLVATAHDFLATTTDAGVQLHHYTAASVAVDVMERPATLRVRTDYPWDGTATVELTYDGEAEWELSLRVPQWCQNAELIVDGVVVDGVVHGGYARLSRRWTGAHLITLRLSMPVRLIEPHPRIDAARGCVAIARGPVLHALEQVDLPTDVTLEDLRLVSVSDEAVEGDEHPSLSLTATVSHVPAGQGLYRDVDVHDGADDVPEPRTFAVPTVPYHRWGNRSAGAMRIWIPRARCE